MFDGTNSFGEATVQAMDDAISPSIGIRTRENALLLAGRSRGGLTSVEYVSRLRVHRQV